MSIEKIKWEEVPISILQIMKKETHWKKRRYNQHPGHYPEDFEGYKKKGRNEETKGVKKFE